MPHLVLAAAAAEAEQLKESKQQATALPLLVELTVLPVLAKQHRAQLIADHKALALVLGATRDASIRSHDRRLCASEAIKQVEPAAAGD